MTIEKVRKILFEIADQCAETANILHTEDADERCEAVDIAIEILGKQIPKEFTIQHSVFDGAGKYLGREYCPECDYALNYPEEFCPRCGQRILWEEE